MSSKQEKIKKFYQDLKDIRYGWHDRNNTLHKHLSDGNFKKEYKMQKISKIKESNHAICWEMCELERQFFKQEKIHHKVIFALLQGNKKFPCHTFLIYEDNGKWYWFEASWDKKKGIHEYASLVELLDYIRNNFYDFVKSEYDPQKINFYEYKKPFKRMSCNLFYFHCMHGRKIG